MLYITNAAAVIFSELLTVCNKLNNGANVWENSGD